MNLNHSGIIRRTDDLCRISLTRALCLRYDIDDGTPCELIPTDEGILVKKYAAEPIIKIEDAKRMYVDSDMFAKNKYREDVIKAFDNLIELLRKVGE